MSQIAWCNKHNRRVGEISGCKDSCADCKSFEMVSKPEAKLRDDRREHEKEMANKWRDAPSRHGINGGGKKNGT